MPSLTIDSPSAGIAEPLNKPFQVSGQATDKGMPEPVLMRSVTVQIDDGPEIPAHIRHIADRSVTRYSYTASAQITNGSGPHTLTVKATNENGITATKTETLFGQQVSDAPAIVMDVLLPYKPDVSKFPALIQELQNALLPLSTSLSSVSKELIGPNIFIPPGDGATLMRIGLWVEDAGFPSIASDNNYPLPRLSDAQAADGFVSTPALPQQDSTFAFSISSTALQVFADAALASFGGGTGYSLDSVSVRTSAPSQVITSILGSAGGAGFEIDITETLSLKAQPDGSAAPSIDSSYSTSVGSTIDWFIPLLNVYMLGLWGVVSHEAGGAVDQATGAARAVLKDIPTRIPFRKNLLPEAPDFPVVDITWKRLGTTNASIEGAGYATVEARDQSTVALSLDGPSEIDVRQDEATGDEGEGYEYTLVDITPDSDKFRFTVAASNGTSTSTEAIGRSEFTQNGVLDAIFRLPMETIPGTRRKEVPAGNYTFTLSVNAIETCDTDASKTLQAFAEMDVTVRVKAAQPSGPGHTPVQPR